MVEQSLDLNGNKIVNEEELEIIYEGSSFNDRMEIPYLVNQLKSSELVIRQLIYEYYKSKKISSPGEIKIFLKIKRGSFKEIISVIFSHPLTQGVLSGSLIVLFEKILHRKDSKNIPNININVENLIVNLNFITEIKNIVSPLQNEKDKVTISSNIDENLKIEINYSDKIIIKETLKKLEQETAVDIYEEDFFGYLGMVNLYKEKYAFTLEETSKPIPISFFEKPELKDIKDILGERIKIKANAYYRNKELTKLDIIQYEKKERKNLRDFFQNKQGGKDETK